VTEKEIEFDLYVLNLEQKEKTIEKLEVSFGKKIGERDLEIGETTTFDKEKVVNQSVELFNAQRYWECHETLEQLWRKEPKDPEKEVQQGIILAASALVHYQKNENEVCLGMIPKALSRLEKWTQKKYYSIDVDNLKTELEKMRETRVIRPFKI